MSWTENEPIYESLCRDLFEQICEDRPDLTYAQELLLKWFPSLTLEDDSKIVAKLLPQTNNSFEMATLALITNFCTDEERAAIFNRYLELFEASILVNDTAELDNLLSLAAYWKNTPSIRPRLTEVANKAASIETLSLPEKRVTPIVAAIHFQIDTLSGKYAYVDEIPA